MPHLISDAGFEQVQENPSYMTIFSTLCLYSARKPEADSCMQQI